MYLCLLVDVRDNQGTASGDCLGALTSDDAHVSQLSIHATEAEDDYCQQDRDITTKLSHSSLFQKSKFQTVFDKTNIKNITTIYACKICSKTFKGQAYLTLHQRAHYRVKRHYACTVCDKTFPSKPRFIMH